MNSIANKYGEKFKRLMMYGFKGGNAMADVLPDPPVALSESEIAAFEKNIGTNLPDGYRSFLLEIGGAVFFGAIAHLVETKPYFGNRPEFSILLGGKDDAPYSLWNRLEVLGRQHCVPDGMIPIGENGDGDTFFLVVKVPDRGKIFLGMWGELPDPLYLAANSFEDFLNRLEPAE